ncbi:MAG: Lrp/AsnC ligand binding domain-containing protein [Verrucomicrobia bacterium]|nr:Lrp/AsnC ligand binding domain-containing protein [Verrucomicrobiota bacterium]
MARLSDPQRRVPALSSLSTSAGVRHWDAVEGHVNLVIHLDGPAHPLPLAIAGLDGLREVVALEILSETHRSESLDLELRHAYVFIESEPARTAAIKAAMEAMDPVASCAVVRGGCDLVVVVQGESFTAIDRFVNDKIQHLDGILRLKKNRVIDLKQL